MHAPAASTIPTTLLLKAYRAGIFPMADARDDNEIFWVEPRERAILPLDGFHCGRSLRRVLANDRFHVTCDKAFCDVVRSCAAPREDQPDSWISRRIEASYIALADAGHAHSVECWYEGRLVGGLYGVAFDKVFCGESMFSGMDNASKVALAWLVAAMRLGGYHLLDCQFMTGHLASLGAVGLTQARYRHLLREARGTPDLSIPAAIARFQAGDEDGSRGGATAGEGVAVGDGVAAGRPVSPSSPGKLIAQFLTQTS